MILPGFVRDYSLQAAVYSLVFSILFVSICHAQSPDIERIAPKPVPPPEQGEVIQDTPDAELDVDRDKVLVDSLNGLVFIDKQSNLSKSIEYSGVKVDIALVSDKQSFISRFQPYLQQPLSLNLLDKINREVVRYFREQGFPIVDAFAPEGQDITNGVVQLVVIVARRGEIRAEGARHFSNEKLASQLSLKMSEAITLATLQEDISWLNNNPFRTVDVLFERGKTFGETDIVLDVSDRFPLRVYAGLEDSGTELTGKERWLTGFNWGNAFGLDHQLSYQFSSSFDTDELNAHTFNYIAPLPWRHTASVFGAYVESDPPVNNAGFNLQGKSWQIGGRYTVPLKLGNIQQQLVLGADFKRSNNDLEFGALRVFNTFTNIIQFNLGYSGTLPDKFGVTGIGGTINYSPGGISSDNNDLAFNASRAGASADYLYARFNLNRVTRLPRDFTWAIDFQLQISNSNLLGSEQLGIGGYRTVRGYDEYAVVGDEGITLRNELRTPAMSLLKRLNINGPQDNLQFLAFVDYGVVRSANELPGEQSTDLLSAGVGLRYEINPFMTLRADYGWQLKELAPGDDKDNRLHASLVIGY